MGTEKKEMQRIYVCSFDGSADDEALWQLGEGLPFAFSREELSGRKKEKLRQRILAWRLLEYGMKRFAGRETDPAEAKAESGIGDGMADRTGSGTEKGIEADTAGRTQSGTEKGIEDGTADRTGSGIEKGIEADTAGRGGYRIEDLDIRRGPWGKPRSAAHSEICFNISHCPAAAACILGKSPVGVDVERAFPYRESLARRICQEAEWKRWQEFSPDERERQLRALWSMKESYVKRDGRGLGYGVEKVDFSALLPIPMTERGAEIRFVGGEEIRFLMQGTKRYTLAACGSGPLGDVCQVTEEELLSDLGF